MKLTIFTDGGARGNPGPAALGVVMFDESGADVARYGEYLGEQTNNYAEYMGVISAMEKAKEMGASELVFKLDSKLVVEQLQRNWKVKEPTLQKLFIRAYNLMQGFDDVSLTHVRREENKEADAEVNKVLDARIT